MSLLRIARDRDGALELTRPLVAGGRHAVGAVLERGGEGEEGARRRLLLLEGRTAADPNAPQLEGTGEIRMESADRASGYFTTRSDTDPSVNARTSGVYLRADPTTWASWTDATIGGAPS